MCAPVQSVSTMEAWHSIGAKCCQEPLCKVHVNAPSLVSSESRPNGTSSTYWAAVKGGSGGTAPLMGTFAATHHMFEPRG